MTPRTLTRISRSAEGLPPGSCLYCVRCQGSYSATPGDYYNHPQCKPIVCQDCGHGLALGRLVTRFVEHKR